MWKPEGQPYFPELVSLAGLEKVVRRFGGTCTKAANLI